MIDQQTETQIPKRVLPKRRSERFAGYVILLGAGVLATLVSVFSPVSYAYKGLDPSATTLTAQAIIQRRSLRLDGYTLPSAEWVVTRQNGHTYNKYPIGPPLFAIPFVAIALLQGKDMQAPAEDYAVQGTIAVFTVLVSTLLIYALFRSFTDPIISGLLTFAWTLGTGIISTMGAAFWSINFTVVWELVVLLVLARYYTSNSTNLRPILLGFALFAGYLCRPTAALLAIPATIIVWRKSRGAAVTIVVTFGLLMLALMAFSFSQFGSVLPKYYNQPEFLKFSHLSWRLFRTATYGLTFSPGRGLFVYQPFLIMIVGGLVLRFRNLRNNTLFWLATSWLVLNFAVVARWPMWWGGGSFGSRLLVESFPGWILLTALLARELGRLPAQRAAAGGIVFGMLTGIGLFLHCYEGLYNRSTADFNATPGSYGENSANMLDWRHPQFLATPYMITQLKGYNGRH